MKDRAQPVDPEISTAYREIDVRHRISRLKVALVLSIVFIPAGVVIDLLVYPGQAGLLAAIRLATAALLGMMFPLTRGREPSFRRVRALGVAAALVMITPFCLMVWATEGAASPYYAGINLIILGLSVLMPWTRGETLVVCVAALVLYAVSCLLAGGALSPALRPDFLNNSFFILITSVICVVSAHIQSRARFEDFRLRHQLDLQNRDLQALDEMKTSFFSNITHELRTPLTLLLGPIESSLKRREALDPAIHDNLILAQRNALRLLKLINDLLDLTRFEQAGGDASFLSRRPVELGSFLGGLVDSIRHLGMGKGLVIRLDSPQPSPVLYLDPGRFEKIVLNLLTNAVKFTPRGGRITVEVVEEEDAVEVRVSDTGRGIEPGQLPRIFDRFYQVSGNSNSQSQGVGIGLALAKELTEVHGGTLTAQSQPGVGTTFTIRLPRIAPPGPDTARDAEPPIGMEPESEAGGEPFRDAFRSADRTLVSRSTDDAPSGVVGTGEHTVLVIDDEPDMLRYLVGFLAEKYRVVQAGHGAEAEALVTRYRPRLALLDWMLPGRDGLAICKALRADPANRDLKIVLLTARVDEESKLAALQAGADDFLTKPFSIVEVETRVENLIRTGTLQNEIRERNAELEATIHRLQETEAHLIQSEKMNALGSLSAGLLHEVNNPLNYAYSGVQLLEMDMESFDENTRETIRDMKEGMERVRNVITDLKSFAYPEKADQLSDFEVGEALATARKLTTKELDNLTLTIDLPGGAVIHGQKTQWIHVFINLLTNAAKAVAAVRQDRPGEIRITGKHGNDGLIIRCEDNGTGIPEGIRKRIFDPFFTTRDVGEGMGMGLSICRTIVENHHGSIDVESVVDQGTTFVIRIPESARTETFP